MTRYFCTYFDRNYLVKGLTMIESLRRTQSEPFRIFVICIDELTRTVLDHLAIPEIVTVPLHWIEQGDRELAEAKTNRKFVGYLWTLTPVILLKILQQHPEVDTLVYVDADLLFFSSSEPIFEELGDRDVLIHEHRFPPAWQYLEAHGKYNVGLLCFKNTTKGRDIAKWWRDRCLEWCDAEVKDGKMGDQAYLNDWPERFPSVTVTKNIGVGVAPWNHDQYIFGGAGSTVTVDGKPVVFYHFHSFTFTLPELITPILHDPYTLPRAVLDLCVMPYVAALHENMRRIMTVVPSFNFGLINDASNFNPTRPFLLTEEVKNAFAEQGFTFDCTQLSSPWWYAG